MVEVHLYGNLRQYAPAPAKGHARVLQVRPRRDETVGSLLHSAGIPVDEVNHIFLNARLLATRSHTAKLFGYPQAQEDVMGWDLAIPVADGARIGLFGRDMVVLGM
jgi:hypothetical protein